MRLKVLDNFQAGPVRMEVGITENDYLKEEIISGERLEGLFKFAPLEELVSSRLVEVLPDGDNALALEGDSEEPSRPCRKKKK